VFRIGSALILVGWIRIRIQEGKMIHKNKKREEISSFEVLDALFSGLKAAVAGTPCLEA
jgi:hypothetical protein